MNKLIALLASILSFATIYTTQTTFGFSHSVGKWSQNGYTATYDALKSSVIQDFVVNPTSILNNVASTLTIQGSNVSEYQEILININGAVPSLVSSCNIPGSVYAVHTQGTYAYISSSESLEIIDISDPITPSIIGSCDIPAPVSILGYPEDAWIYSDCMDVRALGNYAYVAQSISIGWLEEPGDYHTYKHDEIGSLKIIDISNPANPFIVGFYDTSHPASTVYIEGNYAYIGEGITDGENYSGLVEIIDITNSANPFLVGFCNTLGWVNSIYISGEYAYTAQGKYTYMGQSFCGLEVLSLSDIANPYSTGSWDAGRYHYAYDVYIEGSYAYVANEDSGLKIIDIDDPINPILEGFCSVGRAFAVNVQGSFAYVADNLFGLKIVNIRDTANPTLVGYVYTTSSYSNDLCIEGNYAYIATENPNKVVVIDISNSINASQVGLFTSSARQVIIDGGYAYVASGGLKVLDVSNPSSPVQIGSCSISGISYHGSSDIYIEGDYAYITAGYGGFYVVDISDPTNPFEAGDLYTCVDSSCQAGHPSYGIYVVGDYAYVANSYGGLIIVDVSDPTNLSLDTSIVGRCITPGSAHDVYIVENYAYVADQSDGLQIIDISDPTDPYIVGSTHTSHLWSVYVVKGAYVYVIKDYPYEAMQIIDISNPTDPVTLSTYDLSISSLHIEENLAYMAADNAGLKVLNVSDPATPYLIGTCSTPGPAASLDIKNGYAYVSSDSRGLVILQLPRILEVNQISSNEIEAVVPAGLQPGNYDLFMINANHDMINLKSAIMIFDSLHYPVLKGWSMISLPVDPPDKRLDTLFSEAVVVYGYEKGIGYVRVKPDEDLEIGKGYWILLDEGKSYTLPGQPISSYTYPVFSDGWAIIGGCSSLAQASSSNCNIGMIYKYVQGIGYQRVLASEYFEPGKGYWILLTNVIEGATITVETID